MNIPLKKNITYKTKLHPDIIVERLLKISSGPTKSYEGQIDNLTFDITRVINYRNYHLPIITGIIHIVADETVIDVEMQPSRKRTVLISIWFICCGLFGFLIIPNSLAFIPILLIIYAIFMTIYMFKKETTKSKKDLQSLFEADIIDAT